MHVRIRYLGGDLLSACSALSKAFSLSSLSICIFFLMASMAASCVRHQQNVQIKTKKGVGERLGRLCRTEHEAGVQALPDCTLSNMYFQGGAPPLLQSCPSEPSGAEKLNNGERRRRMLHFYGMAVGSTNYDWSAWSLCSEECLGNPEPCGTCILTPKPFCGPEFDLTP
ncbi:hypothetical protein EYF80_032757 [Liparis tanakae]|uniref:Uncharacterized protein n=1 Tax=Liparis tanakae TaxID=230148 RepID=A0A4Z2GU26_9TELE|nr:hypothetical protein EYF80_032757 [Liparis tanakae]